MPSSWKSCKAEFSVGLKQKCGVISGCLNTDLRTRAYLLSKAISVKWSQGLLPTQLHGGSLAEQEGKKEWLAPLCASDGKLRLCFSGVDHMGIGKEGGAMVSMKQAVK